MPPPDLDLVIRGGTLVTAEGRTRTDIGVGFNDLHRNPSGKRPLHRCGRSPDGKACRRRQDRQKHHDRDDPRHRAGESALWQDAAR